MRQRTEQDQQYIDDHEWTRMNAELIQQHGGKVVAVHKKKVWGVGADEDAAFADALKSLSCPGREKLSFFRVPTPGMTRTTTDEFGNVWPEEPPIRHEMAAREFAKLFKGCNLTIVGRDGEDRVIVGGDSEEALEQGLEARYPGTDLTRYRIKPGPFDLPVNEALVPDGWPFLDLQLGEATQAEGEKP